MEGSRTLQNMSGPRRPRVAIFDLDGTLVDSDRALADAFVTLGVPRDDVTFGHVLADECERWGITVEQYRDAYDASTVHPFDGVDEIVRGLGRWAVCSNKIGDHGRAELLRFGWTPEVAMFAESFGGPKSPAPVLRALGLRPEEALFIGDTAHDRACALSVGVPFALAGWNPRAVAEAGDLVLASPIDVLGALGHSD